MYLFDSFTTCRQWFSTFIHASTENAMFPDVRLQWSLSVPQFASANNAKWIGKATLILSMRNLTTIKSPSKLRSLTVIVARPLYANSVDMQNTLRRMAFNTFCQTMYSTVIAQFIIHYSFWHVNWNREWADNLITGASGWIVNMATANAPNRAQHSKITLNYRWISNLKYGILRCGPSAKSRKLKM